MKITSKAKAMSILRSGSNLIVGCYCTGKYKWTGKSADYIGKEVEDLNGVHAVYVERRTDSDGPYARMMSIHEGE
jgi:hypothetical protein